ncbi:hypothetical protein RMSM_04118 [Rhodopirellula maiorica SM1]|uniref:Uncharacterized protein n=1 Tax=Rhodopirellula maiorica SM1 TaxID=1265738 RepID=M5RU82_9BACT|nr:hypothetical protein RMSM_04118 [Rhodopirellula maiorica SM1]
MHWIKRDKNFASMCHLPQCRCNQTIDATGFLVEVCGFISFGCNESTSKW